MRIGLIGNGHWARVSHAPGLQAQPEVTLTGVWGRDLAKSESFAGAFGISAYRSVDELLDDVDAVDFSVPPSVQSELAVQAAGRGKHLLLEKPIAVSVAAADELAAAATAAGVASVVFFTSRFDPVRSDWLASLAREDGWSSWDGASGLWLGSAFAGDSPFDTPWRHDMGGLWDVGPHALSLLAGSLGPIAGITARAGQRDLVQLIVQHVSGACSSYAVSIDSPVAVERNSLVVWGESGTFEMPAGAVDAVAAMTRAAGDLAELAELAEPAHPCDVQFGRQVVRLLADAEAQLSR
jgi:predicted dehydrogenase